MKKVLALLMVLAALFAVADDDFSRAGTKSGAFSNRTDLVEVVLPESVTNIAAFAFYGCTSLTNVICQSSTAKINASAFEGCTALESIVMPGVNNIGNMAFSSCTALQEFDFPTNLSFIGKAAFSNCTSLASVEFPESLASVNGFAFADCHSLTNVDFAMYFPVVSTNQTQVYVHSTAFEGSTNIVSATLPAGKRANAVFPQSYSRLERVNVATGEVVMVSRLLESCTNLVSVSLPESFTNISSRAFADCVSLKNIDLPSSINVIDSGAFSNCVSLGEITIPEAVANIKANAFADCKGITNVTIEAINYGVSSSSFSGCDAVVKAKVPGTVAMSKLLPDSYYSVLKELEIIVEAVEVDDEPAEEGQSSASAPSSASLVAHFCENCRALEKIELPDGLVSIGNRAFFGCISAKDSITIPASVTTIDQLAFAHCREIDRVYYLGDKPDVKTNIYYGTSFDLASGVLRHRSGWGETATTTNITSSATNIIETTLLPMRWPTDNLQCGRAIAWWTPQNEAIVAFYNYDGRGSTTNIYTYVGEALAAESFPDDPKMSGYSFLGWFTAPYGGFEREEGFVVTGSMTLYPHWEEDSASVVPFPLDEPGSSSGSEGEEAGDYDFSSAHTYVGYLTDGGAVVGSASVTIAKGRYNRASEETNANVRATVQLLGAGKLSFRGTMAEDGSASLEAKGRELDISADAAGLTGSLDGYELSAWENLFSAKTFGARQPALAELDDHGGSYTAAFQAEGSTYDGYAAAGISIGARGKTRVTGIMPDGTRINATAQMIVSSDISCVPVVVPMYRGKKGGFGFLMVFNEIEDDVEYIVDDDEDDAADDVADDDEEGVEFEITGISPWYGADGAELGALSLAAGAKAGGLAAGEHSFSADVGAFQIDGETIEDGLSPDGTTFTVSGAKWTFPRADTVRFYADEGYEMTTDNGNPAALKLSYNSRYGTFKGSFKVFSTTEAEKSKRRTATVNGVIVGGTGYGSAVIKKVGSIPVTIE